MEPDRADEMTSVSGHRTLFSADTNSHYWRLIRKGTGPAFITKNIKHALWACSLLGFGLHLWQGPT